MLRSAADLVAAGLIAPERSAAAAGVAARYALAVSPQIAALIDPADPVDPIALQFLPDLRELNRAPGERDDPIGDDAHSPVEGIVHRYPDRVLLKIVQACPVYCRFCFRRESVGQGDGMLSRAALAAALAYLAERREIWEVILTGGDPLALSPRRLAEVMRGIAAIDHVKIVRIHTRVPVVDSARVTPALIDALKQCRKTLYVALHANHPRELTGEARQACALFVDAGLPMVSQSVLLRGVNDSVETLAALMRGFVEARVKPYYVHHADLAPGTAHLRVPLDEGRALMRALRGHVSGLCQPHYMVDIPGGYGKAPVGPDFATMNDEGWRIADFRGGSHAYAEPGSGAPDGQAD